MKKRIISILFTAWLLYAFGSIFTIENPNTTQIFISLVALVFALVLTVSHWRYFSSNQLRYLFPLKDVAKLTLKNDYKEFASLVKQVIKEKLPYIIGIDKEKYYTEYIDPNDHDSLNRRYLMQAKEKDIHIIKRNGSEVQEISIINYTGDNLEDYFFTYALKKKVFLDIRDQDFIEKVSSLIKPYGLNFSFSYIEHIKKQYTKDNTRYEIQHDLLKYSDSGSGKVWTVEKIERFKQTAVELEKNGYIFFIASYGNYKYGYGVIKKKEYRKLQLIKLKKLQFITVYEFLEKYIGEQSFTKEERFFMFYDEIKHKINKEKSETIYILTLGDITPITLSKIGGIPVGVNKKNYPMYDKNPMSHVWTLDLNDMPLLQKNYPDKRAISLYISDYVDNEAYSPDTSETKVLFLSQKDIDERELDIDSVNTMVENSITITPINIPKGLLEEDISTTDKESWQAMLYSGIYNTNYASGSPIWMQGDEYGSDYFICQFDNSLEKEDELNIAYGIMYVFEDTAFWQC